ncbi:MAG TPA: HAMP domain-containing sensor histidine kinase [Thermoanaerobaculia bacterium]|nr:HAMP domain-containing sensor histidine kinase [Thermoanaerobaculia bacterium]
MPRSWANRLAPPLLSTRHLVSRAWDGIAGTPGGIVNPVWVSTSRSNTICAFWHQVAAAHNSGKRHAVTSSTPRKHGIPHLFEQFQKGTGSRGSGLGLAIARKLVPAHGGEIGIESAPGRGTEVTVSLPR